MQSVVADACLSSPQKYKLSMHMGEKRGMGSGGMGSGGMGSGAMGSGGMGSGGMENTVVLLHRFHSSKLCAAGPEFGPGATYTRQFPYNAHHQMTLGELTQIVGWSHSLPCST